MYSLGAMPYTHSLVYITHSGKNGSTLTSNVYVTHYYFRNQWICCLIFASQHPINPLLNQLSHEWNHQIFFIFSYRVTNYRILDSTFDCTGNLVFYSSCFDLFIFFVRGLPVITIIFS